MSDAMTTPTSEPTRVCELCGRREGNIVEIPKFLAGKQVRVAYEHYHGPWSCITFLESALANAERERETADDKRRQTEAAHADLTLGLMSAYEDLATVRAERDALQRTVAGLEAWLFNGDDRWLCVENGTYRARCYEHEDVIENSLTEIAASITTPTREGSV